jgi:3',5'-nucleoside bisphosphate phosphatase
MVVYGAEVTTKEDVHCICLFGNDSNRLHFQEYIEQNLPNIKNNPDIFGHQLVVNEREEILDEIEPLLISGLNVGINDLEKKVHLLGGLFIPAHIDRLKYSLISQLGFVPKDLNFDALEISKGTPIEKALQDFSYIKNARFIKSSDSHTLNQLGSSNTFLKMEDLSWSELKMAIQGIDGRDIILS